MLRRSTGAVVAHHLLVERRRRRAHVPALDAEAVVQPLDRGRLGLERVLLRSAQRLGVHEGEVREVRQVVHDQQVVRVVVQVARMPAPARVAQVREVEDLRRVRFRRIAHPDPDQAVAFDHRIAAHAELGRNVVLPGNLHALARRVEFQPVVHAAHAVALDAAVGEQRAAMAAAVVERHRLAGIALVQHDRLVEDGAREQLAVDQLVVPGRDVPAVHEEGFGGRSLVERFFLNCHGNLLRQLYQATGTSVRSSSSCTTRALPRRGGGRLVGALGAHDPGLVRVVQVGLQALADDARLQRRVEHREAQARCGGRNCGPSSRRWRGRRPRRRRSGNRRCACARGSARPPSARGCSPRGPATPGRSAHTPRTIRSICTPACEAA